MLVTKRQDHLWITTCWDSWYLVPACDLLENGYHTENSIARINKDSLRKPAGYTYWIFNPDNDTLLVKGICASVEDGKKLVEKGLIENGFIC